MLNVPKYGSPLGSYLSSIQLTLNYSIMKKLYALFLFLAVAHFSYGQLIINEVLYDPSNNALDGDANRDGVYGQDDDSFVEIYNSSASPFDISGWEIWDDTSSAGTVQYTFPANTLVPALEAVLVFGGGTPTGTFGNSLTLNAVNGFNFNNSGEVIGIKDTSGAWALLFDSDALSNNPNESYTRFPDITGPFLQHSDTTAVLFSPGTRTDGTPFSNSTGIGENKKENTLNIFPNPVKNQLNLQGDEKINRLEIFNINGAMVFSLNKVSNQVDVSSLSNGIYILRVNTESGSSHLRFIKD